MRRKTLGTTLVVALGLAAVAAPAGSAQEAATADAVALQHVRSDALGLSRTDVDELEITDSVLSRHSGVTHVYLRQQHRGLDVLDAVATVNVSRAGEVVHTGSRLLPGLHQKASGTVVLDAAAAYAAAAKGLRLAAPVGVRELSPATGTDRATVLTDGGVAARPVRAHLAYQALEDGTARLVWVLDIELPTADHWYLASVDAETGRLLSSTDLVVSEKAEHTAHALARPARFSVEKDESKGPDFTGPGRKDGSSYRVFALPLESPNDGERTVVEEPAHQDHSPFGWHDLDGAKGPDTTTTKGNNVHAYADTGDLGVSYVGGPPEYDADAPDPDPQAQPDGGAGLDFDFPFTPDDPTALQNRQAAVTNLFYMNNTIHDVLAHYGFDEAAGNFQHLNYSGAGVGGDSVMAQAQDGGGPNNANFATPAEGSRPRMQMFLWDPSVIALLNGTANAQRGVSETAANARPQLLDGDFDNGVIAHEYGHGVSNRLTGGPSNVTCLRTNEVQEQMGEGWSDYFGYALTMRAGDKGSDARGIGNYVLYNDQRTDRGIRPTPYSTDMTVNPSTYDTVKTAVAPHGVGYVWASMLYELYWALVEEHGFNADLDADWSKGGNNLANQLVMDGMKFQPCKPGFEDGRDAILAADAALTGGDNRCTIWTAFAKRGLGSNAVQGTSASKTDGRQGFGVPADCRPA